MREDLIFTSKEARFLKELVRNKVPFMIVGLSAAALQGAPVVTQDIDLWFKNLNNPGIKKALKQVDGAYVPPLGMNPPAFAGDHVDPITAKSGWLFCNSFEASLLHITA